MGIAVLFAKCMERASGGGRSGLELCEQCVVREDGFNAKPLPLVETLEQPLCSLSQSVPVEPTGGYA